VPSDYDVEVIEASKVSSSMAYKQFIDQQNVEIAVSIIGGNLSTEVQGGSYAAATAQMLVRADIIESDKVIVQGAFDELIRIVHAFNFRGDKLPYFRLYTEAAVDKTRSERDLTLSRLGVKFTPAYIAKAYDLQETDFVLKEVQEVSNVGEEVE
jgi:phage gp29-like protein